MLYAWKKKINLFDINILLRVLQQGSMLNKLYIFLLSSNTIKDQSHHSVSPSVNTSKLLYCVCGSQLLWLLVPPEDKIFKNASQIYSCFFSFPSTLSNFLKLLVTVVFINHYSNMLGTIFSGGWLHIWCSSKYLWQLDSVCEIESK